MPRTLGGIYKFHCGGDKCFRFEVYAGEDEAPPCPECGNPGKRLVEDGGRTAGFRQIQYSRALGVDPSQIAEAKAKFPHHEFAPDGRMIFENAQQLDRAKKDLGFEHF